MPNDDADVLLPWDRHFPTKEAALRALRAIQWPAPGALYDERYWTLAVRWIAERTQDAVDGVVTSEVAAEEAVSELQDALEEGELRSSASVGDDPVLRDLPAETWGVHQVCLREENGLLWPCVIHDATEREQLNYVRLRREDLLRRWPPREPCEAAPAGSMATETTCRRWLTELMRGSRDTPRPKKDVRAEANERFPALGKNASIVPGREPLRSPRRQPGGHRAGGSQIKSPHLFNRTGYYPTALSAMS